MVLLEARKEISNYSVGSSSQCENLELCFLHKQYRYSFYAWLMAWARWLLGYLKPYLWEKTTNMLCCGCHCQFILSLMNLTAWKQWSLHFYAIISIHTELPFEVSDSCKM